MEKRNAGNAPFYAAMAVCLLAAGVGTWQILRPAKGLEAVSASVPAALPARDEALLPSGLPDRPEGADSASGTDSAVGADSGTRNQGESLSGGERTAASGAAEIPRDGASALSGGAADSGAADNDAADRDGAVQTVGGTGTSGGADGAGASSSSPSGGAGASNSSSSGGASSGGKARTVCAPLIGTAAAAFSMDRLQYNETLGDWRTHDGLDITAELGTAVAAACGGTVSAVAEDPLMGVTVTIRHDGGYETTYAGLQETSLEAGDQVAAGGVIGTVGDTAAAEAYLGPHLHFSVRQGGVPLDPEEFLSGA